MKRAKVTPVEAEGRPDWLTPLEDPRDEAALAAAFDVFAEKGFDGATMNEIAAKAGVSKRTLYEKHGDKAGLFRALLAWGCRQNLPEEAPAGADAEAALVEHARAVLGAIMRPESIDLVRIVAAASPRFPEIGALFDDMTRGASVRIVKSLARRLAKEKRIGAADPERFAADFIGLLRGDLYHRALIGVAPPLAQEKVAAEAKRAVGVLLRAYA